MSDPKVMISIVFRCAGGEEITREWTMAEIEEGGQPDLSKVPEFLDDPYRDWPEPQSPIYFGGDVKPGREDEARAWVEAL